jgi:hypothetical protein
MADEFFDVLAAEIVTPGATALILTPWKATSKAVHFTSI